MSLAELAILLQSAAGRLSRERKQKEAELKTQIILLRNLSLQIGESVGLLFRKENSPGLTPLSAYYPGLFDDETETKEISLQAYTDLFTDYAYRQNMIRRKRGGDNADGRIS